MPDNSPAVYLAQIGLRPEVLRKLNADYIFTLKGLAATSADRLAALLTEEERKHLAERVAAATA